MTQPDPADVLRVVAGGPTEEEVVALVAALAAAASARGGSGGDGPGEPSAWADRAALLRAPLSPGPGAWRAAARLR